MNRHRYSFFGQKSGILLDSGEKSQNNLFFSFLKKKSDQQWERPTNGEGKNIKFNMLEMIHILRVLEQKNTEWSTVHRFKEDSTPITWKNTGGVIQISIPGYSKMLKFPESKLLFDLISHIYTEKIEYATGFQPDKSESKANYSQKKTQYQQKPDVVHTHAPAIAHETIANPKESKMDRSSNIAPQTPISPLPHKQNLGIEPAAWLEKLQVKDDFCLVPGELIAEREKAIAFRVSTFNQIWIPRSLLKTQELNPEMEGLWIKHWFLTKKLEDIFNIATH